MEVELRVRGIAERVVRAVFPDSSIESDAGATVIRTVAVDEAAALALIDRAREVGLVVVSWKVVENTDGRNHQR